MYIHINNCLIWIYIYNVSQERWDKLGILTSYRSPMNRRYYTHSQYNEYMGITKSEDNKNVIYKDIK